jgi:hypothetical protein
MTKRLAMLSLLVACMSPSQELTQYSERMQVDIFTNKWWEMESGPSLEGIGDDCFMLNDVDHHSGGTLISHAYGQAWPYFTYYAWWEYGDYPGQVIVDDRYEVEITPKGNRCWNVKYSIYSAVACRCSYDTTNVDYLVE